MAVVRSRTGRRRDPGRAERLAELTANGYPTLIAACGSCGRQVPMEYVSMVGAPEGMTARPHWVLDTLAKQDTMSTAADGTMHHHHRLVCGCGAVHRLRDVKLIELAEDAILAGKSTVVLP